jgi:hypothetical protein
MRYKQQEKKKGEVENEFFDTFDLLTFVVAQPLRDSNKKKLTKRKEIFVQKKIRLRNLSSRKKNDI